MAGVPPARASHVEAIPRLPAARWVETPSTPQFAPSAPSPHPPAGQEVSSEFWGGLSRGCPPLVLTGGDLQEEREWKGAVQGPRTHLVPEPRAALFAGGHWGFPLMVILREAFVGPLSPEGLWDAHGAPVKPVGKLDKKQGVLAASIP